MAISKIENNSLASGAPSRSQLPAGTVLQVVQTVATGSVGTTSSTPASSNIQATITPTSATNKILAIMSSSARANPGAAGRTFLYRNGSNVNGSVFTQNQQAGSGSIQYLDTGVSFVYLDSPASTSALTYAIWFASTNNSASFYLSVDNSTTTLTLMEIAA